MNKLDLHVSMWINLKNIIVSEKASCKIRYMYGIIYVHFKNIKIMSVDMCTCSRSIETRVGMVHTIFGVGEERDRDKVKGV